MPLIYGGFIQCLYENAENNVFENVKNVTLELSVASHNTHTHTPKHTTHTQHTHHTHTHTHTHTHSHTTQTHTQHNTHKHSHTPHKHTHTHNTHTTHTHTHTTHTHTHTHTRTHKTHIHTHTHTHTRTPHPTQHTHTTHSHTQDITVPCVEICPSGNSTWKPEKAELSRQALTFNRMSVSLQLVFAFQFPFTELQWYCTVRWPGKITFSHIAVEYCTCELKPGLTMQLKGKRNCPDL